LPSTFVNRAGEVIRYGFTSHLPHVRRQLVVDEVIEISHAEPRKAGYRWIECCDVTALFRMAIKNQHKPYHPFILLNLIFCNKNKTTRLNLDNS